jgi:hypothetical protein
MHRALALSAITGAALAVLAAPAAASSRPAAGTAQITSLVFTDARMGGGNTFYEGTESGIIDGTLTGTYVERFRYVVHPDGSTSFQSDMTFTGAAEGCGSGTIPFVLEGQGDAAGTTGTQTAVGGDVNTLGVDAHLRFSALLATGTIDYSGAYQCP